MKSIVIAAALGILVTLTATWAYSAAGLLATNEQGIPVGTTEFKTSKGVVLGACSIPTQFAAQAAHENGTKIFGVRSDLAKVWHCTRSAWSVVPQVNVQAPNAGFEYVNFWSEM